MDTRDMILICKALSDTNRLEIVQMLSDGEKCGCKILDKFDITQPTLSHTYMIMISRKRKVNYPQYKVMPYLADTLDKGPKKQVKQDQVFNPFEKPDIKEKYAVIVGDTAVLARMIGREYYEGAEASMVIDHHASNEGS